MKMCITSMWCTASCLMVCCILTVQAGSQADGSMCDFEKHTKDHKAMAKLKTLEGKRYSATDDNGANGWTYNIGICTTGLSKEYLPPDDTTVTWSKAASIQKKKGTTEQHNLGDFTKTELVLGTNWLQIEYEGGENYNTHCDSEGKRTIVMVVCDPDETAGRLEFLEENTNKTGDCYYLFELSHSAVCDFTTNAGLGTGTILLIVLLSVAGAYLLIGFMYQRFVRGMQGREQLPNYAFWQDAGNLAADGCDYVCRSNTRGDGSRQYRGIGDDQLTRQQTPEDPPSDTDEHLLPM